jgi:hypothetical protein
MQRVSYHYPCCSVRVSSVVVLLQVEQDPALRITSVNFHSAFTVLGQQTSLVVGLQSGKVFRLNMDFEEGDGAAPVVFLKSAAVKEYANPIRKGGALAFTSPASGKNSGNAVERELYSAHHAPIVFICMCGESMENIVSVDAEGIVAVWSGAANDFMNIGCFQPMKLCKADLNLRHLTQRTDTSEILYKTNAPQELTSPANKLTAERNQDFSAVDDLRATILPPMRPEDASVSVWNQCALF